MSTATIAQSGIAPSLRRLYFVRFAFAVIWAVLVVTTARTLNPVSVVLLVLYPAFDVLAAIVDIRAARPGKPFAGLYVNIAISVLAAVGVGIAASAGIPGILRVWGIWAAVSGLVQLIVGIARRRLGGQWPMMISGTISVLAGLSFILQAAKPGASFSMVAGYALLGGIFFLISAFRLGRTAKQN